MRCFVLLLLASTASATLQLPHVGLPLLQRGPAPPQSSPTPAPPRFLTPLTEKFAVNGSALPNVDFDVGESYAGSLPISDNDQDPNKLFFWFFPSENQTVGKEITIWLTGGPGCSSIGELLSENGPMLWQPGVFKPVRNKWSWHRLTNVIWIDQPIGSGFSQGEVTAKNEYDVAKQFLGFWKNVVKTFSLQGYKIYVTGSSYSGMYCPYVASAMLDTNDTQSFNVAGMQIFDGSYSEFQLAEDIPVANFVTAWSSVFGFNDSFTASLRDRSLKCGYDDYLQKYNVFPPKQRQPSILPGLTKDRMDYLPGCGLFNDVFLAAFELNPCFSAYRITDLCPMKYDPIGFSDSTGWMPDGAGPAYFNRPDVKAVIHAPNKQWDFCTDKPVFVNSTDNSLSDGPGSQPVLPNVIDRTKNVILGHGSKDFVLIADGTLLTIQNLTFGGMMGFQSRPTEALYVPYHYDSDYTVAAGAGVIGTVHSERGLTYFGIGQAGHFMAADVPAVAFRSMEVLLGRIEGFQSRAPFTIDANHTAQPSVASGNGTVMVSSRGLGGAM